jgi:molecular chaperone GrpE (heat shock protein)
MIYSLTALEEKRDAMLDFETELNKLLSREIEPLPRYEFAPAVEMATLGQELLADLRKKQTDVSLQVEEIYDILKDLNTKGLEDALDEEKKQADRLAKTAIALSDMLEDFYSYAKQSGSEELKHQTAILWTQAGKLLMNNNIVRFGGTGKSFNPKLHSVQKGVESPLPKEQVLDVLQSGYVYKNVLVRKAAVVVSVGQKELEEIHNE